MILALSIAAAVSGALAIAASWREPRHRSFLLLKPLTTALVIGIALAHGTLVAPYTQWVVAALALSLAGDVCLMYEGDRWFLGGLGSFLLAHLAFVLAFLQGVPAPALPAWLAAVALYAVALLAVLLPRAGPLRLPVLLYCAVLGAMVAAAAARHAAMPSPGTQLALCGALLFMLSDSALGWRRFVGAFRHAQALILSTYWAAIGLIAWSV
jgi:alkenylglycerophosphocholine hydrolase